MTYKTPSIRLTLNKALFNKLLSILDNNINLEIENSDISKIAEKMKEKLLTYSVPRLDEDNTEFVDVRFYPNEASNMIYQILVSNNKEDKNDDYYSILINQKRK